jgi:hypothetical protein
MAPSRPPCKLRSRLTVTVIVCAHNEETFIATCLYLLLAQTRAPDEILVINNASTDRTGAVARAIPGVRWLTSQTKGWSRPASVAGTRRAATCSCSWMPTAGRRFCGRQDRPWRKRLAHAPRDLSDVDRGTGARTRQEFMDGLWAGQARAGGQMGNFLTMGSDVCRFTGNFLVEQSQCMRRHPGDWRPHVLLWRDSRAAVGIDCPR